MRFWARLIFLLLFVQVSSAAARPASDLEDWGVERAYPEYRQYPAVARDLRCQSLFEAIAWSYFGAADRPGTRLPGVTLLLWGNLKPRLSAADEQMSAALLRAALAPADRAWGQAKAWPNYSASRFSEYYQFVHSKASDFVGKGLALQALTARASQCLDDPAAAPVAQQLRALLARPAPTAPKIGDAFLPRPMTGYLYRPIAYRHIVCAGLAWAATERRFGYVPGVADAAPAGWEKAGAAADLAPEQAALRTAHREAARTIFLAGMPAAGAVSATDKASYRATYGHTLSELMRLVKDGKLEAAMRAPALKCTEFAGITAILSPAAASAMPAKPVAIRGWPDRTVGYLANAAAFRPMFCSALAYTAYMRRAGQRAWFPAPSDSDSAWMRPMGVMEGELENAPPPELPALRKAVYALYAAGQTDAQAKRFANMPFSPYGGNFERLRSASENILKDRQAAAAFAEPSLDCRALPQLAPVLAAIEQRLAAEDRRR